MIIVIINVLVTVILVAVHFVKALVMEDVLVTVVEAALVDVIQAALNVPEAVEVAVLIIVIQAVRQDVKMLAVAPHVQQPAEQHALDLLDQQQEIQIKMEANKIYDNTKH